MHQADQLLVGDRKGLVARFQLSWEAHEGLAEAGVAAIPCSGLAGIGVGLSRVVEGFTSNTGLPAVGLPQVN